MPRMSKIFEQVVGTVVGGLIFTVAMWAWGSVREDGGLIRALGGVTQKDIAGLSKAVGEAGDPDGDSGRAPASDPASDPAEIDFGDNNSQWMNDGECDDPRFEGPGMAFIPLEEDRGRDATDCRELFERGLIRYTGE